MQGPLVGAFEYHAQKGYLLVPKIRHQWLKVGDEYLGLFHILLNGGKKNPWVLKSFQIFPRNLMPKKLKVRLDTIQKIKKKLIKINYNNV